METVVLILLIVSVQGSRKNCAHHKDITICRENIFKTNESLELDNNIKTLKLAPPIDELPPSLFVKLSNLEYLIVNFTLIEKIHSRTFEGLINLKELNLYWNQISHIPSDTFEPCPNLIKLNLGGNNLDAFNEKVLSPLKLLKELVISSNLLSSVPSLSHMNQLELLDLSRNKIKKLQKHSFGGLTNLVTLNLKGNQIYFIETDSFLGLAKLNYLNLGKNQLDVLDVENIAKCLNHLMEIKLSINNFSCGVLKEIVEKFNAKKIQVPEGYAEPGPITYNGIFCLNNN